MIMLSTKRLPPLACVARHHCGSSFCRMAPVVVHAQENTGIGLVTAVDVAEKHLDARNPDRLERRAS